MVMLDLHPSAGEVSRLLAEVREEQLAWPTPCTGYPVAALLDHLMSLSQAFACAARKVTGPHSASPPVVSADNLDPDWRAVLPKRLGELADAWQDLVLHGWDLARSTGQRFECDPASAVA